MKNTLIKVLSFMMALTMIVGCFSAITVSAADECAHANATKGETVAPTCSEFGYTWYTCPDCGKTYKSDLVEPSTSHNPVEVPASDATCTSPALTAGVQCADCEAWITPQKAVDGKPALKHNFVLGSIVVNTCTEDAYRPYVCTRCDLTAAECQAAEDLAAKKAGKGDIVDGNYAFVEGGFYSAYANDKTGLDTEGYKKTGHKWVYTEIVAPSKCTSGGAKGVCEVCGATQTIEAKHIEAKEANKAKFNVYAIETESNKTDLTFIRLGACSAKASYWECKECKKLFNEVENTNAVKHAKGEIKINSGVPYVETLNGNVNLVDMKSFRTYNAVHKLPVAGAVADDFVKTATCTAGGYAYTYCKYCDTFAKEDTPAAHDWNPPTYFGIDATTGEAKIEKDAEKPCIAKVVYGRECKNYATCKGFEEIVVVSEAVAHEWKGVTTPANCTASGYITYTCQNEDCKATYVDYPDNLMAVGHKWSEEFYVYAGTADTLTDTSKELETVLCTSDIVAAQKCLNKGCTAKNVAKAKEYPATSHYVPKAVDAKSGAKKHTVDATCAAEGYTYYACQNDYCQYYMTGEDYIVPNSKTAKNPNNHATSDSDGRLVGDSREVKATCTTNAKWVFHCAGCDKEKIVEQENTATGHTYATLLFKEGATSSARKDAVVDVAYTQATCQKDGNYAGALCLICRKVLTGVVDDLQLSLLSATEAAEYTHLNDDGVRVYNEKETFKFDHKKAYEDYLDGDTNGDGNFYEGDHAHAQKPSATKTVLKSCLNDQYTIWKYAGCCGMTFNVVDPANKKLDKCEDNAVMADGKPAWVVVPAKAPECEEAGAYAHSYCRLCGKLTVDKDVFKDADNAALLTEKWAKNTLTTEDLTIPATGHSFTVDVEAKPAKCDRVENTDIDGYTAHKKCSVCNAPNSDYSIVRAHSANKYLKFNEAVAATCTTAGRLAGKYCSVCVEIPGTPDYNNFGAGYAKTEGGVTTYPNAKKACANTETKWFNKAYDEKTSTWYVVDCTKPYFQVETCLDCGTATMIDSSFVAAAKAHALYDFDVPHVGVAKEGQALKAGEFYACQKYSYTTNECANCAYVANETKTADAISHYYYVGETKTNIDVTCANIAKFDGVHCALCGDEVFALLSAEDYDVDYNAIKDEYSVEVAGSATGITTVHDWDITYIKPTCTTKGVKVIACADCGIEVLNEIDPALTYNHNPYWDKTEGKTVYGDDYKNFNEFVLSAGTPVAPTMTTDGYVEYRCKVCNEDVKYVIPAKSGVAFGLDIAEAEAKKAFNGGKFNATITASATNFAFNEFEFDIYYTSGIVATGAEVVYDFGEGVYYHVEVVDNGYDASKGCYNATVILAISNDNATKAPTVATVTGDKVALVNVEFEVLEYSAGSAFVGAGATISVLNEKGEVVVLKKQDVDPVTGKPAVDATTGEPIMIPDYKILERTKAVENFATIKAGDYNGDGALTAADTAMIDSAIKSDEYIDILDFDGDEAITLNDYVALLRFRGSKQTYGDYLELINIDYNDFVKSYNLIVDLDGDKTVTDNDYALISLKLGNKLYSTSLTAAKSINAMIDDIVTGSVGK